MKQSVRLILPTLFVLLVTLPLVGFLIGRQYQPLTPSSFTPTPTSLSEEPADILPDNLRWSNFNDTHYEYSIDIPPSWDVRMDPDYYLVRFTPNPNPHDEFVSILNLSRYPNLSGEFKKTPMTINGQSVEEFESASFNPDQTLLNFYVKGKDDNYYSIQATYQNNNPELRTTIEKMVSTFKFPVPYPRSPPPTLRPQ